MQHKLHRTHKEFACQNTLFSKATGMPTQDCTKKKAWIERIYPKPWKPLLTFIYPGVDCGSSEPLSDTPLSLSEAVKLGRDAATRASDSFSFPRIGRLEWLRMTPLQEAGGSMYKLPTQPIKGNRNYVPLDSSRLPNGRVAEIGIWR